VKAIIFALLFLSLAVIGTATPITYIEQATASGTIGTLTFTDALLSLTFTGSTTNVTGGAGFFSIDATDTVLNIGGIGLSTVTDSGLFVFVNQDFATPVAGFASAQGSILDTMDSAFGTYGLTTSIGPITDGNFIRPDLIFATTLGGLDITSAGNSTFRAFITASPVPEPSSLGVLLFALGLGVATRRIASVRRGNNLS
jgi:PEP-CTERM motif